MKTKIVLLIIVALSGLIRFWGLSSNPPSLNWDEASLGYNAYSVLKTGKDEWGSFLPAIFPAFGDYKLPAYIYLSVPFIWVFGLNTFSVRFLSALAGTLTVLVAFFLAKQIFKLIKVKSDFKSLDLSLLASAILGLLPWHFFLSRPALEANLGLCLFSFGLLFLLKSVNNFKFLLPASLLLGLSMHAYNSYRILVPAVGLSYFIIYFKQIKFRSVIFIASFLVALLFSLLIIFQIKEGSGLARYQKLKILNDNNIYQIGEMRTESNLPDPLPKLIYNRPVYFVSSVVKNYLSYFTPQFWNQSRGAQYQFAIPGQNLATVPVLIFALAGIFFLLKTNHQHSWFLLVSFLLTPLAASLTIDPPQAIRPSPMIIFVSLFACLGLYFLSSWFEKKKEIFFSACLLLIALFSVSYLYQYWTNYYQSYSASWQYGYQQVFAYLSKNHQDVEKIFITKRYGEPHIFHLFYNQVDPNLLHDSQQSTRFPKSDWLWTDKVANYYFVNDWQIPKAPVSFLTLESGEKVSVNNSILVTSPENIPTNSTPLSVVNFLDGKPAFIIVSIP